jgi:hypothetical protein
LNVIERKRWVKLYLGYYLELMDDDQRGVLEDGLLPCHFTTQEEKFLEVSAISFKRFAILLCQGIEGRLDNVVFVEV